MGQENSTVTRRPSSLDEDDGPGALSLTSASFPSLPRETHTTLRRRRDYERRLGLLPKVFAFLFFGWCAFFVTDVYVALVSVASPFSWLLLWRVVGALLAGTAWLLSSKRKIAERCHVVLEMGAFLGLNACLSIMAIRFGGLGSVYAHGVMLLVIVQTIALPARYRRSAKIALAHLVMFPLVMAVAAPYVPGIAAQWRDPRAVATFVQAYVLVTTGAIGACVGGHLLWAARRQLYYARRLGRYRLTLRLGRGGMGEVWLAWDEALKRDVALKILRANGAPDGRALARFEREALSASALRSPNTIRVYDYGATEDGVWFIAMERLDGADLATLVHDHGPLPAGRIIRFARQACASLAEAHEEGIVHRDIKPDNLYVCQLGDDHDFLKVVDFGVAKLAGTAEDVNLTGDGWVTGTPAYMSPEACAGQPVDARGDIYSLGAVLYFVATGRPPFTGSSANAVMAAHLSDRPRRPSDWAFVPSDLEDVIVRCLTKKPEDRYKSVRALDEALAKCEDAGTWSKDDARTFWTALRNRPRTDSRRDLAELQTVERPSLKGMKAG